MLRTKLSTVNIIQLQAYIKYLKINISKIEYLIWKCLIFHGCLLWIDSPGQMLLAKCKILWSLEQDPETSFNEQLLPGHYLRYLEIFCWPYLDSSWLQLSGFHILSYPVCPHLDNRHPWELRNRIFGVSASWLFWLIFSHVMIIMVAITRILVVLICMLSPFIDLGFSL